MNITDLLEALMILCFGISWPLSIYKSWKSRTAKGKSLTFELFKQGKNWKFSVGGALENLADEAIEKAGDELESCSEIAADGILRHAITRVSDGALLATAETGWRDS